MNNITCTFATFRYAILSNITPSALTIVSHLCICSFDRMTVNMGFCIESREDAEMPEVLLGCVALNKPSVDQHPQWVEGSV